MTVYAEAQSTDVTVAADAGSELIDESEHVREEARGQTKARRRLIDGVSRSLRKAMPTFRAIK